MIHLTPDVKLNLVLANTNKAFAEAIKNATPEELNQLKEGKDIKSLLTSVVQEKITSSKSDQTLLDLLKNSSAFKNMGNLTEDFKSLVSELKNTPGLTLKSQPLEGFFKNIGSIDTAVLKSQVASSGVFMESKIAAVAQILPSINDTLQSLRALLSSSRLSEAKQVGEKIAVLLESPLFKQPVLDLKSAENLTDSLKKITDTLKGIIAKSDVLYSKETVQLTLKIEQLSIPDSVHTPLPIQEIKKSLSELYGTLLPSKAQSTNALLDSIELLLKNISKPGAEPSVQLKELSVQLRQAIASGDPIVSDDVSKLITRLGEFARPKELAADLLLKESLSNDLKSELMKLSEELKTSTHPKAGELLDRVDKLLTQIDYHQLVSYMGASNSIYIPFEWDQLEDGSLTFKKTKEKKFYCEINLQLKEYGKLDLMMALYDENQIEIQAHTEKPELKELIQEHIKELRALMIDAGLMLRGIRVFEHKENQSAIAASYSDHHYDSDSGFEVKV